MYVFISVCFTPIDGKEAVVEEAVMCTAAMDERSAEDFYRFLKTVGFTRNEETDYAVQKAVQDYNAAKTQGPLSVDKGRAE